MKTRIIFVALGVAALTASPVAAQGVVRGAQQGAATGNTVAGPVGGAVGGVVGGVAGGVAGGVKGVLGIPQNTSYSTGKVKSKTYRSADPHGGPAHDPTPRTR